MTYVSMIASAFGMLLLSATGSSALQRSAAIFRGMLQSAAEDRRSVDPIFNTVENVSCESFSLGV